MTIWIRLVSHFVQFHSHIVSLQSAQEGILFWQTFWKVVASWNRPALNQASSENWKELYRSPSTQSEEFDQSSSLTFVPGQLLPVSRFLVDANAKISKGWNPILFSFSQALLWEGLYLQDANILMLRITYLMNTVHWRINQFVPQYSELVSNLATFVPSHSPKCWVHLLPHLEKESFCQLRWQCSLWFHWGRIDPLNSKLQWNKLLFNDGNWRSKMHILFWRPNYRPVHYRMNI